MGGLTPTPLRFCVLGLADSPHEASRAEIFARLGHKVVMVSQTPGQPAGVRVIVANGRPFTGPVARLALAARTAWAVLTHPADVTHAHYAADYGAWIAAFLRRKPLVISVMGGDVLFDEQGSQGPFGRFLTRFALARADLVTVKTAHLHQVVAAMGVPEDRIMDVVWGVDLESCRADAAEIAELRRQWGVAEGDRVLLSPRMLRPFYNHHLAIEALPAILARASAAVLVMMDYATDADYRRHCLELAERLGVAHRVRVVPPRDRAGMPAAYAASELIISVPPSDGLPQSIMEAGAMHRPTVMTDLERFHDTFTDGENVVFTALEPAALAAAVGRLTDDAALRARVAAGARAVVEAKGNLAAEARRVVERIRALRERG